MPELPEVETLRRQLEATIIDERIQEQKILDEKLGDLENTAGRRILAVERHGKYLSLCLDSSIMLQLHLRMTGRLLWQKLADRLPGHSRFVLRFAGGKLVLVDPRRFATISLGTPKTRIALIKDPLHTFGAALLWKIARGRQRPIKTFLLDQTIIAGIGNIYACEMLFAAAVSPWREAGSLSRAEFRKITKTGRDILQQATDCRGTSISDWRDLHGKKGEYQFQLAVYGKEGLPCPSCGAAIRRDSLGGRGTYYCEKCQK